MFPMCNCYSNHEYGTSRVLATDKQMENKSNITVIAQQ